MADSERRGEILRQLGLPEPLKIRLSNREVIIFNSVPLETVLGMLSDGVVLDAYTSVGDLNGAVPNSANAPVDVLFTDGVVNAISGKERLLHGLHLFKNTPTYYAWGTKEPREGQPTNSIVSSLHADKLREIVDKFPGIGMQVNPFSKSLSIARQKVTQQ